MALQRTTALILHENAFFGVYVRSFADSASSEDGAALFVFRGAKKSLK